MRRRSLETLDFTATPRKDDINPSSTLQQLSVPDTFDKILTPARIIITGPTMSGKSHFIYQLIKFRDIVFESSFEQIIYCLPPNSLNLHIDFVNALHDVCSNLSLIIIEDMPDLEALKLDANKRPKLLVIDDLMRKALNSSTFEDIITQKSHHANISIILTTQNIFLPSRNGKSITRNCSITVIFFDGNDVQMLGVLSMQMFPKGHNFLHQCFDWIHRHPDKVDRSYLIIDSTPRSPLSRHMKVRTNIFPTKPNLIPEPLFFFPEQ